MRTSGARHQPLAVCSGERACDAGPDAVCPDAPGPCFAYVCSAVGRCELAPTNAPCDDGEPCTVGDHCEEGLCRGADPEQYLTCGDPHPYLNWEGVCAPQLGGVAYVFYIWYDDEGQGHGVHPETCATYSTPCGEVAWWEVVEMCAVVVR